MEDQILPDEWFAFVEGWADKINRMFSDSPHPRAMERELKNVLKFMVKGFEHRTLSLDDIAALNLKRLLLLS